MTFSSTSSVVVRSPSWAKDHGKLATQLLEREWLVTLGNGGYASGTVGGIPSRRHHGWLIAALPAPLGRTLTLSHLREEVTDVAGETTRLWGQQIAGEAPQLHGCTAFADFRLVQGLPEWYYQVGTAKLRKTIVPVMGQNSVLVHYELISGDQALSLNLRPLVQFRGHDDSVNTSVEGGRWEVRETGQIDISFEGANVELRLALKAKGFRAVDDPMVIESCYYRVEDLRGYDHIGSLWSPGELRVELAADRPASILVSTEDRNAIAACDTESILYHELKRRQRLLDVSGRRDDVLFCELVLAADQFLITPTHRAADHEIGDGRDLPRQRRSVIAGYPWFTDWGRDTMISLSGLTLSTGRVDDARDILVIFSYYVRDGLIPNLFPEGAEVGMYHTADATLWFFEAIAAFEATNYGSSILAELEPTLSEIVDAHLAGTRYGIGVDKDDGLLVQGAPQVQLTWMDAKVDDWVVTPRRGKAVEINALWYNALRHFQTWMQLLGRQKAAKQAGRWADRAYLSFNERFWCDEMGYLYDVVDGEAGDDVSLRPNQLFAISLPYAVLSPAKWQSVMKHVSEKLFTPIGLRSLAPCETEYRGKYIGDLWARDAAYHQGTVWSWLIGPYLDACRKLGERTPEINLRIRQAFDQHLSSGFALLRY